MGRRKRYSKDGVRLENQDEPEEIGSPATEPIEGFELHPEGPRKALYFHRGHALSYFASFILNLLE